MPGRRLCRGATLSACLPQVSLTFLVVSLPDGGRRARYGKLRFPSCAPFHPPGPPLPWLSYLLGPRSGPVSFWEKLTRATSRSAIAITLILRARLALRGGLQGVLCPGEVLRQHGASGKAGSWRREAVTRKADPLPEALLPLGRCAGGPKGERKARGRRNSKSGKISSEAP